MDDYQLYRNAWRYAGPPHLERKLNDTERKMLLKKGGVLIRNTFGFDQGNSSFWFVIKDKLEDINNLRPRTRTKIRAALNAFSYQLVDAKTIEKEGYAIIAETYLDYQIKDREMNEAIFSDYLENCKKYDYDFWGIFNKETGQMVGFCSVWVWSECCEFGKTGLLTQYKHGSKYPYYGLYYTMNHYYLKERQFQYVSDGSRTITEHSNIQDFLIQNFNFRKAYCRLEIHYQWWMKIAVNLLYPFRNIITLPRVKAVLNMEAMQRGAK